MSSGLLPLFDPDTRASADMPLPYVPQVPTTGHHGPSFYQGKQAAYSLQSRYERCLCQSQVLRSSNERATNSSRPTLVNFDIHVAYMLERYLLEPRCPALFGHHSPLLGSTKEEGKNWRQATTSRRLSMERIYVAGTSDAVTLIGESGRSFDVRIRVTPSTEGPKVYNPQNLDKVAARHVPASNRHA